MACPGGTDCDDDGDNSQTLSCGSGGDCDDGNPIVNPQQTDYFGSALPNGGFDYNCSGVDEPEFGTVQCSGILCGAVTNYFLADVPCGTVGSFGNCSGLCQISNLTTKLKECR